MNIASIQIGQNKLKVHTEWVYPNKRISVGDLAVGTNNIDVSTMLPDDGNTYEIEFAIKTMSNRPNCSLQVINDQYNLNYRLAMGNTTEWMVAHALDIIDNNRKMTIFVENTPAVGFDIFLIRYRRFIEE